MSHTEYDEVCDELARLYRALETATEAEDAEWRERIAVLEARSRELERATRESVMSESEEPKTEEPKPKVERTYRRRTDAELEQLAQDIYAGHVFTSAHCPPADLGMVFMPLIFTDQSDIDWMKSIGISLFYEYMDKASPRSSVNGLPSFFSMHSLDEEDHKKLIERYRQVKQLMDARKAAT